MDVRSAELVEQEEFKTNVRKKANDICALEKFTIAELSETFAEEILPRIVDVVMSLNINHNISKVVVGSKALHHIIPDLIPPIDRSYTGRFFSWHGPYFQYRQEEILREGLVAFNAMARECRPERLVGPGWRTSRTKILDNAIAGYCILEKLPRIA